MPKQRASSRRADRPVMRDFWVGSTVADGVEDNGARKVRLFTDATVVGVERTLHGVRVWWILPDRSYGR